jgi:hypothetical protein
VLALLGWQGAACAVDVYIIDRNSSKSSYADSHIMHRITAALEASRPR